MALIEVILKEAAETPEEFLPEKVKGWQKRCTDENISLYALEKILALEPPEKRGQRSMYRFVSSLKKEESEKGEKKEIHDTQKDKGNEQEKKKNGFISSLKKLLGSGK